MVSLDPYPHNDKGLCPGKGKEGLHKNIHSCYLSLTKSKTNAVTLRINVEHHTLINASFFIFRNIGKSKIAVLLSAVIKGPEDGVINCEYFPIAA